MIRGLACLTLCALWACGEAKEPTDRGTAPGFRFLDVTEAAGLDRHRNVSGSPEQRWIVETMSAGAGILDADGDGALDLFLVGGTRFEDPPPTAGDRLFRQVDRGPDGVPRYADATAEAGLDGVGWGMGVAAADVDADADPDLYVTRWGRNELYRNRGDGTFAAIAGTASVDDGGWGSSAAFGDLDADGLLDLYVTNYLEFDPARPPGGGEPCSYRGLDVFCGPLDVERQADRLYRNLGGGRFEDMSLATGVASLRRAGLGVLFADLDGDGDQDLYVANDSDPNTLYRNDGDWRLTEHGALAGAAFTEDGQPQAGMGVDAGDYDRDGDLDLVVTNFADDYNTLYENDGAGRFTDASASAGLVADSRPLLGWSTAFVDFDNDGWLDLFVSNGHLYPQIAAHEGGLSYPQADLLHRNWKGRFTRADGGPGWDRRAVGRAAAVGDLDDDGDADLLFVDLNERPTLLLNDGGNRHAWVGLRVLDAAATVAVGARVELFSGGARQIAEVRAGRGFQSSHDPRLLFGLGAAGRIDSLRVRFPSGRQQRLGSLETRRYHTLREGATPVAGLPVPAPAVGPAAAARPAAAVDLPPGDRRRPAAELVARGKALYLEGRYRQAEAYLRRAMEMAPDSLQVRVNLAVVLHAGLGRAREAAELLSAVARAAPGRADVHLLLGKVHLSLDQASEAASAFARAAELSPRSYEAFTWVGVARLREDDLAGARQALERAVRLGPGQPRPHLLLAQVLDRLGRTSEARRLAARHARLAELDRDLEVLRQRSLRDPSDLPSRTRLGNLLLARGDLAAAGAAFQEALALEGAHGPAWYGLASVLVRYGDMAGAEEALRQATTHGPGDPRAWNDLGMTRLQLGRAEDALRAFRRALALRDDVALVHANLGRALLALKRTSEARRALERALELDPGDRQAAEMLRALER